MISRTVMPLRQRKCEVFFSNIWNYRKCSSLVPNICDCGLLLRIVYGHWSLSG